MNELAYDLEPRIPCIHFTLWAFWLLSIYITPRRVQGLHRLGTGRALGSCWMQMDELLVCRTQWLFSVNFRRSSLNTGMEAGFVISSISRHLSIGNGLQLVSYPLSSASAVKVCLGMHQARSALGVCTWSDNIGLPCQ